MRARLFAVVVGVVALAMLPPAPVRASEVVATVPVSGTILSVAHDDTRKELWVANFQRSVTVVDTETNAVEAVVPLPHSVEAIGVNSTMGHVYAAGDWPARVSIIDIESRTVVAERPAPAVPRRVAVDGVRNRAYITGGLGTVGILDGASHELRAVDIGGAPYGVDVDEGRHRVYVADPDRQRLVVLDATTGDVVKTTPLQVQAFAVAVDTTSNRLYLSGAPQLLVVDAATLEPIGQVATGVGDVVADSANRRVYTDDMTSNRLHVLWADDHSVLGSVTVGARPVALDVDSSRRLVFVANQAEGSITVVDDDFAPPPPPNQAPDCSDVAVSPTTLWPANRALVTVGAAGATDADGDAVVLAVTGVTQDEPVGEAPDAAALSGASVQLRAEREGGGDGRVYRVAYAATDTHGATCSGTAAVTVPQRPKSAAVDSGATFDSFAG